MIAIRIGDAVNRGHGYGREALALAVAYCWNHLNLSRIGLTVFHTNDRARNIYLAAGFAQEGILQKAVFIDGEWVDVIVMAINHPTRTNPGAL
jgi:RimJ/RimL family protein N-acetyltransferase